jgi:hypothetical protein
MFLTMSNIDPIARAKQEDGNNMDRYIFMTFDDFVLINTKLLSNAKLELYRSESYDHPYIKVDANDPISWRDSELKSLSLLAGNPSNEDNILRGKQIDIPRTQRIGFVDIQYGGDDEDAIGATHYGADKSETANLLNRELNKLLKHFAHKNLVDCKGNEIKGYYWTDAALSTSKNWHRYLSKGTKKHINKNPGYRPAPPR